MIKLSILIFFFLSSYRQDAYREIPIVTNVENNKQENFENFFTKFVDDINTKDIGKVDKYIINGDGLYVIYNVGAFDTVRHFESFKEFLKSLDYTIFSLYRTYKNNANFVIDISNKELKLQKPNQCIQKMCNCYNETENNYFILDKDGHKGFIKQIQENDKFRNYPEEHKKIKENIVKLRDIESKIDKIVYIDGFYFFFIKISGHWYLTGLDISECGGYSNE